MYNYTYVLYIFCNVVIRVIQQRVNILPGTKAYGNTSNFKKPQNHHSNNSKHALYWHKKMYSLG